MNLKFHLVLVLLLSIAQIALCQKENKFLRAGNAIYEKSKFDAADLLYRKALDENANSFEGHFNLGNALYKQGKFSDAEVKFNRAAELATTPGEKSMCFYNQGNSLLEQQKYEDAINAYKSSLREFPGNHEAQYNLTYAMNKLKEQQKGDNSQDNKQDQNKDNQENNQDDQQNKEKGDKNDQESKDQDKNGDKNENPSKESQDGQNEQKDQKQQSQPDQPQTGISKEEAIRILEALEGDEKKVQAKILRQKGKGQKIKTDKEW